uniref:Tr-type G domain-containing protein n=1 Tax=Angiostrongylus cantonensis TaxID=6313 RepID=A0A0K0D0T5_ANGCA
MNQQPLRSQSFKYRARPGADSKKAAIEDVPHERRRSTPTISRRRTTQEVRTDVWPEAKPAIEFDEKFLKLPSSDEYKRQDLLLIIRPDIDLLSIIIKSQIFRVRQFKIDEKGAVVSRGDSFRRKRNDDGVKNDISMHGQICIVGISFIGDKSPSPYMVSGSDSTRESRSDSVSSSVESRRDTANTVVYPSTSHNNYKIGVVGDTGTGKTSLIGQLITSEYKNAFADEIRESLLSSMSLVSRLFNI